jgi:hypothetical protein
MSERRPNTPEQPDPYWQDDVALGEGRFYRETFGIRARVHTAREEFRRHHEIIPLSATTGERTYVHAKPYILVPDVTLTVSLYPRPQAQGAIGEVADSDWTGMRHEEIGQAQAWFYPTDRIIMLWECFLEERFRQEDPREDPATIAVWRGFERLLVERFPDGRQLVTPWEDIYERPVWQAFVESQGYEPFTPATFTKQTTR